MSQTFDERIGDLVEIRREIARLRQIESNRRDPRRRTRPQDRDRARPGRSVEQPPMGPRRVDEARRVPCLDERLIDPDTGEVEPSWVVVTALRECAGISYWRIGALRDRGLDPDEFAETTSEARSVRIL